MPIETLQAIGEAGANYWWGATKAVMVDSGMYYAVIGIGCVLGLIALVMWGVSVVFPRRISR